MGKSFTTDYSAWNLYHGNQHLRGLLHDHDSQQKEDENQHKVLKLWCISYSRSKAKYCYSPTNGSVYEKRRELQQLRQRYMGARLLVRLR